jgi:IS1 family transposase
LSGEPSFAHQDGSRTNQTIGKLYEQLREKYRDTAQFYTDYWHGFRNMLPRERLTQTKKYTYRIESVFSAVRQRGNRLVRQTVGFSQSRCPLTEAVKFAFATFKRRDF